MFMSTFEVPVQGNVLPGLLGSPFSKRETIAAVHTDAEIAARIPSTAATISSAAVKNSWFSFPLSFVSPIPIQYTLPLADRPVCPEVFFTLNVTFPGNAVFITVPGPVLALLMAS